MSEQRWSDVDTYLAALFTPHDDALQAALDETASAGMPSIAVSPVQGKLLHILARSIRARRILEIGTLGGYSTIWMARALDAGGRLVTLESEDKHAQVARANIERAGLDSVEVRVGPAQETLPRMIAAHEEPYDMVFIDADKEGYPAYLDWSLQLTRPGSIIVADNVVRDGQIADPDNDDPRVVGVRRFNELLAEDPRVRATVLQTVGAKGYDGLAFAVVL